MEEGELGKNGASELLVCFPVFGIIMRRFRLRFEIWKLKLKLKHAEEEDIHIEIALLMFLSTPVIRVVRENSPIALHS